MTLFRAVFAVLALLLAPISAHAQGQIGSGHVLGNSTAAQRTPTDSSMTAIFDRAFGSTVSSMILRGNAWGAYTPAKTATFYAAAYGVLCDGATNDVVAINAANTAANAAGSGIVQMPAGICVVGVTKITLPANVILRGAGQNATTLKLLANFNGNMLEGVGSNSGLQDIGFDAGDFTACTSCNAAIFGSGLSNIYVDRISIKKIGTGGLVFQGIADGRIADSYFSLTTAVNTTNSGINITDALQSTRILVRGNTIVNTNLSISGSYIEVSNNNISGFKFGSGITVAASAFSHHDTFANNVIGNSSGIDTNATEPIGIENWAPYSSITGNVLYNNSGPGILNGGQNTTVTGNTAVDNGQNSNAAGIFSQYSTATFNANNSIYDGNSSFNTLGAAGSQNYGYSENALVTGIILGSNKFFTNRIAPVNNLSGATSQGLVTGVSGGLLYYSGTQIITSSALLATNQIILGGGAGNPPATLGSLGTTTTLYHGNAAGAGSFGPVVGADMTNNTVGNAQLRQGVARSVIGVTGNATANVADIQGTAGQVLVVNNAGTGLAFGALDLASAAGKTGILAPGNGGTGISNNVASTITITGAFGLTFTIGGATGVTLPASGTLATLAGSEELTNKTLTSSVGKGVWTASGTWTLPAFTLGGTVSGGGQQINNVVIGASTPLAGTFSTLNVTTMPQSAAAQSGTVCYAAGTGQVNYDATLGCLASTLDVKDGWEDIPPAVALAEVVQLRAGTFTYKRGLGLPTGQHIGFAAEQIATIDDRLVGYRPDGKLGGVRYQQGSAMYAPAIRALLERVERLESRKQ